MPCNLLAHRTAEARLLTVTGEEGLRDLTKPTRCSQSGKLSDGSHVKPMGWVNPWPTSAPAPASWASQRSWTAPKRGHMPVDVQASAAISLQSPATKSAARPAGACCGAAGIAGRMRYQGGADILSVGYDHEFKLLRIGSKRTRHSGPGGLHAGDGLPTQWPREIGSTTRACSYACNGSRSERGPLFGPARRAVLVMSSSGRPRARRRRLADQAESALRGAITYATAMPNLGSRRSRSREFLLLQYAHRRWTVGEVVKEIQKFFVVKRLPNAPRRTAMQAVWASDRQASQMMGCPS